jgi:hypothetical protein
MTRASALLDFFDLVGWDRFPPLSGAKARPESVHEYRRTEKVAADRVSGAMAEGWLALHSVFGRALELRLVGELGHVSIEGDVLELPSIETGEQVAIELTSALGARVFLEAALGAIAGFEASLDLIISKTRIASVVGDERGWTEGSVNVVFYLFARYLVDVIDSEGLRVLDRALFGDTDRPTVIIVSDGRDLYYRGELLAIIDETQLAAMRARTNVVGTIAPSLVDKYRDALRRRLNLDFQLRHLTPAHLLCANNGREDARLARALNRALFQLSVLYTANRSLVRATGGAPRFVAYYQDRNRTGVVNLGDGDSGALDPAALADFARWPYEGEGRSDDRLDVLRKHLAQVLVGDADENARALLANLPGFLDEVQIQYSFFIEDQLDEFQKQRQALADYTADVAQKVADSVEGVTKGLVDTALATVAAAAAAVLAAVANDKLRGPAFAVILGVYAAYVVLQALYRMLSTVDGVSLLHDEATIRLQGSAEQLGERTVQPLRSMLTRRWAQFRRWGIATAIGYVGIVLLITLLAVLGPRTDALRASTPTPLPGPQRSVPSATAVPPIAPSPSGTP